MTPNNPITAQYSKDFDHDGKTLRVEIKSYSGPVKKSQNFNPLTTIEYFDGDKIIKNLYILEAVSDENSEETLNWAIEIFTLT